jgi:hypothetical protein
MLSDPNGNTPTLIYTAGGFQLQTTPQPTLVLADNHDGAVIDTTYRWQTPVLAGSGTLTQTGGNLTATLGTTAGNGAALTSIETFTPSYGNLTYGTLLITEAAPATNTNRCVGFYTRPTVFAAATPVQDGYVWELDITGAFGASIYNSGVRIFRQTTNAAGAPFTLSPYTLVAIAYQGLNVFFYYNNTGVPAVTVPIYEPSVLALSVGFHAINHTTGPALAPTWSIPGVEVVDGAGVTKTIFNGQTFSRQRFPGKFVPLTALSVASQAAIWTPASGRRFRLMGFVLTSGTVGGNVTLQDGVSTTILTVPFGAAGATIVSPPMGNGILSAAVNNALYATGIATQALSGFCFGTEE